MHFSSLMLTASRTKYADQCRRLHERHVLYQGEIREKIVRLALADIQLKDCYTDLKK